MNGKQALGARVRALREGRQLSTAATAERAGISAARLLMVETGQQPPGEKVVTRLASLFDCDPDVIISGPLPEWARASANGVPTPAYDPQTIPPLPPPDTKIYVPSIPRLGGLRFSLAEARALHAQASRLVEEEARLAHEYIEYWNARAHEEGAAYRGPNENAPEPYMAWLEERMAEYGVNALEFLSAVNWSEYDGLMAQRDGGQ